MPRHSNDLRKRVVDYFLNTPKITATKTIKIFNISKDTLKKWVKWNTEGELYKQRTYKAISKLDVAKVLEYVDNNPDRYNYEIAEVFNSSRSAIQRLLVKYNYSVKKKPRNSKKPIQSKDNNT
jgi:transposase